MSERGETEGRRDEGRDASAGPEPDDDLEHPVTGQEATPGEDVHEDQSAMEPDLGSSG